MREMMIGRHEAELREVTAERDRMRETLRQIVWRDCAGRAWIAHDLDAVLRLLLARHPELFDKRED